MVGMTTLIMYLLLAGFVQQADRINYGMIGRAIRELEGDIHA